jgi:hypothetical protein
LIGQDRQSQGQTVAAGIEKTALDGRPASAGLRRNAWELD